MYRPGEWVSVRAFGIFDHYGLATGDGRVVSNSMRHGGVVIQSEVAFGGGKPVTRHGSPDPAYAPLAVMRAMSRIGAPWRAFDDNCEHFVRWAYGMKPESPQAATWTALSAIAAGALLIAQSAR